MTATDDHGHNPTTADLIAMRGTAWAAAEIERLTADAARYRYLRDHCSYHSPMTREQPAEWSIGWEFQQNTPDEAYGSFDSWIDKDIARTALSETSHD